jgi:hypothetical protein
VYSDADVSLSPLICDRVNLRINGKWEGQSAGILIILR